MSENPQKYMVAFDTLSEFIKEDLLLAPQEDLHAIAHEWGVNPVTAPQSVDAAIKKAIQRHKLKKLHAAQQLRKVELAKLAEVDFPMPTSRQELLTLIADLLAKNIGNAAPERLTIQHRNLQEQTEEDLQGFVRQLIATGTKNNSAS
jgi:hypothetical protein